MNNYSFYYDNIKLVNVKSYKYLGLCLSAYGTFTLAKQELKKVALKALYKLRKDMGQSFRKDPKLTIKLFDTLVSPILLYGSEIWGADVKGSLDKDQIESVHIKFCKMLLGVNKTSSNNACRGELGRYPLTVRAKLRSLSFWLKLTNPDINKLSTNAYNEIKNKDDKVFWSQKIKTILFHIGLGEIWINRNHVPPNDKKTKYLIQQRLQDIEIQTWLSNIHNDSRKDSQQKNKLRTYRTFKTEYEYEDYLHQITNINHRIALTKLRISNHQLEIEVGRYIRPYKKPEDRICQLCKTEVEDEFHFLLKCQQYQEKRKELQLYHLR